jgi:hypothetical protein
LIDYFERQILIKDFQFATFGLLYTIYICTATTATNNESLLFRSSHVKVPSCSLGDNNNNKVFLKDDSLQMDFGSHDKLLVGILCCCYQYARWVMDSLLITVLEQPIARFITLGEI